MHEQITEIFASVSESKQIEMLNSALAAGKDVTFEDLSLDSLKTVEALMALEEKLGIDVDIEEFDEIPSVLKFVDYCTTRLPVPG